MPVVVRLGLRCLWLYAFPKADALDSEYHVHISITDHPLGSMLQVSEDTNISVVSLLELCLPKWQSCPQIKQRRPEGNHCLGFGKASFQSAIFDSRYNHIEIENAPCARNIYHLG